MSKYWDISVSLSYNRLYNFIIGTRTAGKTYGSIKYAINRYKKTGEQFIYLRRGDKELRKASKLLFTPYRDEFPDDEFDFKDGFYYMNGEIIGYPECLSIGLKQKSISYPDVTTVIFDEFLIQKTESTRYLTDEVSLFLNLYETIARPGSEHKDVKVYFLGNAITWFNPYFMYFGIKKPKNLKNIYANDETLIEITNGDEIIEAKTNSRFGKIIKGTEYEAMATYNQFVGDDKETFLAKFPKHYKYYFTILLNNIYYGVYLDLENGNFLISPKWDKNFKVTYTLVNSENKPNHTIFSLSRSTLLKSFRDFFYKGMVFYENNQTRELVQNTLLKIM